MIKITPRGNEAPQISSAEPEVESEAMESEETDKISIDPNAVEKWFEESGLASMGMKLVSEEGDFFVVNEKGEAAMVIPDGDSFTLSEFQSLGE